MAHTRATLQKILFVICILVFGWMIWRCGVSLLWENILAWGWTLLGCILVWVVGYGFNALSFAQVLRCYTVNSQSALSFWQVTRLTITGYALNYLTPFGLLGGEPWRIHQLRKVMEPKDANSAVVYYAAMHVLSHVVFWIIGAVYALFALPVLMQEYRWQFVMIIVGVLVILFVVYRVGVNRGWIGHLQQLLHDHPKEIIRALLLELFSRMVNVVEYWLLLSVAMPDGAMSDYWTAYLVVAFSSLFANILFFCPLQMGSREGGILLILMVLLPLSDADTLFSLAVSVSLATRIREFFWIGIGLWLMQLTSLEKNIK